MHFTSDKWAEVSTLLRSCLPLCTYPCRAAFRAEYISVVEFTGWRGGGRTSLSGFAFASCDFALCALRIMATIPPLCPPLPPSSSSPPGQCHRSIPIFGYSIPHPPHVIFHTHIPHKKELLLVAHVASAAATTDCHELHWLAAAAAEVSEGGVEGKKSEGCVMAALVALKLLL